MNYKFQIYHRMYSAFQSEEIIHLNQGTISYMIADQNFCSSLKTVKIRLTNP